MREIIEQDLCATCAHLRPSRPLPSNPNVPPFGVFSIQCDCAEGWPLVKVNPSANAISECPKFSNAPSSAASTQSPVPLPSEIDGEGRQEQPSVHLAAGESSVSARKPVLPEGEGSDLIGGGNG